jgi:choline dehydrogenase-like flavoprotein
LTLLLKSQVVKLNFQGTRCVGLKVNSDGAVKDIEVDREVILTAGAIGSPKLLLLSGVGDAAALRALGIDVIEHLSGVGKNLQDHVRVSGVIFKYKGKMPDRPADSNAVGGRPSVARARTSGPARGRCLGDAADHYGSHKCADTHDCRASGAADSGPERLTAMACRGGGQ